MSPSTLTVAYHNMENPEDKKQKPFFKLSWRFLCFALFRLPCLFSIPFSATGLICLLEGFSGRRNPPEQEGLKPPLLP